MPMRKEAIAGEGREEMTGATLCSGIGAPEVAMPWVDWRSHAEIDAFPSAVMAHRHGTPNLGDVTADDFIARALKHGPLDLLVAGTPCQAFSVAGRRESLKDARGNITLRFVEIVDAIKPAVVLWENVPGVLNTSDNAFGCFLAALVGAGSALVPAAGQRWTNAGMVDGPSRVVAWRILDAQYFGLAQRRERVFVVASARNGADPREILFERTGMQRHFAPRRETGQTATGTLSARTKGGGGLGTDFDCDGGLVPAVPDASTCLNAGAQGRLDPTFAVPILEAGARTGKSTTDMRAGIGIGESGDPMFTLQSGKQHGVGTGVAVRRLTPEECEALQGFPRKYTLIEYRGKPAADGPRYKALGNSMAVPVIRFIGERIRQEIEQQEKAA